MLCKYIACNRTILNFHNSIYRLISVKKRNYIYIKDRNKNDGGFFQITKMYTAINRYMTRIIN